MVLFDVRIGKNWSTAPRKFWRLGGRVVARHGVMLAAFFVAAAGRGDALLLRAAARYTRVADHVGVGLPIDDKSDRRCDGTLGRQRSPCSMRRYGWCCRWPCCPLVNRLATPPGNKPGGLVALPLVRSAIADHLPCRRTTQKPPCRASSDIRCGRNNARRLILSRSDTALRPVKVSAKVAESLFRKAVGDGPRSVFCARPYGRFRGTTQADGLK